MLNKVVLLDVLYWLQEPAAGLVTEQYGSAVAGSGSAVAGSRTLFCSYSGGDPTAAELRHVP
jgi:hypothetical protein